MDNLHKNRLGQASSPYLQQHANNPVHWFEWGGEALQKARDENKPLVISIGYSACHWCHVMADESYMDDEVADLMNENFVAIKVDREERPDIDQIYIEAAQMLNGNAGWPLNVFALPDGRPFWAGTYFPKKNWMTVLEQLNKVYRNQISTVRQQAKTLTEGLDQEPLINLDIQDATGFKKTDYNFLFDRFASQIDFKKGGLNRSQKFPMPACWEFLLQYHYNIGHSRAFESVNLTLTKMAKGGIYDQIGGGFARYSTDKDWFAPHFEKMLYDNAQLISLYAHAYQSTQNPLYKSVVEESLAFIRREMTDGSGGFYSALNADSEGQEGKFYVWEFSEIKEILNEEETDLIKGFYNIKSSGNWEEGRNILYQTESLADFAKSRDLSQKDFQKILNTAKSKLMKARDQRIRPSTDDKILTAWNALMLKAYIDAYRALGNNAYLEMALTNAAFIQENMITKDGHLYRNYKDGKASIQGFLDDYSLLADAFIALYQVTFDKNWLDRAKALADYTLDHFYDEKTGLFFYSSDLAENLITRKKEIVDNVIPSSNSILGHVLFDLSHYFEQGPYREISETMLSKIHDNVLKGGPFFANWAHLFGKMVFPIQEIAVMGENNLTKSLELQKNFLPNALFLGGNQENLPLLKDKLIKDKTMIYVCQNKTCKTPTESVEDALRMV